MPSINPGEFTQELKHKFVTKADWIPGFWNFLLGLDRNDLVAELVQNDLDQGATRTTISFDQDHLVCDGNGSPVDADGWERLRMIQGAGNTVTAKKGKIGVKNHGLKTAFTIGDEIRVMSAGKAIVQTLYAKGQHKPPHPGASSKPIDDPYAPSVGCRIIVRYRDRSIEPPQGEANALDAVGMEEIDSLFRLVCNNAPEQFAGIVSPEIAPKYELVLQHWHLGEAKFNFSCTRPRRISRRIETFQRRCVVNGTVSSLPDNLKERAFRRLVPMKGRLRERIAGFYIRSKRFFVEVSWPVDTRGKPKVSTGRFRYPIGFPLDSHEARTGHSTHFNAPFACDNSRRAPARNESTNKPLREYCETLLADVLANYSIPHWGAPGLNPLVPYSGSETRSDAVLPILAELTRRDKMPTLKWAAARKLRMPRRRGGSTARLRGVGVRARMGEARRYKLIVPVATWDKTDIHSALSIAAPPSEYQLDPRIHHTIFKLIADGEMTGWCEDYVTFDEKDLVSRALGQDNGSFDAPPDMGVEMAHPLIARAYLDVIEDTIAEDSLEEVQKDLLLEELLLPAVQGGSTRFKELHVAVLVPTGVPGLVLPPVVHGDLVTHPLFKRKNWKRPKYTFASFLDSGSLHSADEETRRQFWEWLRRNPRCVSARLRPKLADLTIWPDANDDLCKLGQLCEPRSRRIATILGDSIRRPLDQLRRSKLVSIGRKTKTSIRSVPTNSEISNWLDRRMQTIGSDEGPSPAKVLSLRQFEGELAVLMKNPSIASLLKSAHVILPALAQDGSIGVRTELVVSDQGNERLSLLGRFLLKDSRHVKLIDKLSPTLNEPTVTMLLDTFKEDPLNFSALHPRLQRFMQITAFDDEYRLRLADLPIIPVKGQPKCPSRLALRGRRGDFWGTWKNRIPVAGLSQNDQRRYLDAGVTSAEPNEVTSRAFFEWLSTQDEIILATHMSCVLRHILHTKGPVSWAETFTDIPFIPVQSRNRKRLVSLRKAKQSPVFLPDAKIGSAIIQRDPDVMLVIEQIKEVIQPISEPLRSLGLKSLRESLREPVRVTGSGEADAPNDDTIAKFGILQSADFRLTFLKRLTELGVDSKLLRTDWREGLSAVQAIHFADRVEAYYRFRRRLYTVYDDGGFDRDTGTFWMRQEKKTDLSSLYEAIAKQLVFKPAARPIDLLALERSLNLKISESSFGRPTGKPVEDQTEDFESTGDVDGDENAAADVENEDLGEAVVGHNPIEPNPKRNLPKAAPIIFGEKPTSRSQSNGKRKPDSTGGNKKDLDTASTTDLESKHKDELRRHYASHCQMCVCKSSPDELAPRGSYVQWEEVRRGVMEAHHVDLKTGGGAGHAGNLILLCKLHHNNFGRRLTRSAVTNALHRTAARKTIRFDAGEGGVKRLTGQEIELELSDTMETVRIFFTNEHAKYWREQAETGSSLNNSQKR